MPEICIKADSISLVWYLDDNIPEGSVLLSSDWNTLNFATSFTTLYQIYINQ